MNGQPRKLQSSCELRWYGDEDGTVGFPECDLCQRYLDKDATGILVACASVGIEHGRSTGDMVRVFIALYHARGHKEAAREAAETQPTRAEDERAGTS